MLHNSYLSLAQLIFHATHNINYMAMVDPCSASVSHIAGMFQSLCKFNTEQLHKHKLP
jgi:hypothetical protein